LQQQRQEAEDERLPAALLSTVCLVLLRLQRQVHPLWLAGMLEAYLRCAFHAAVTITHFTSTAVHAFPPPWQPVSR
jgi:hypothetical protein